MISSAILFSLMSVLVRVVAETQGVNAWKTAEFRFSISIIMVLAISFWLRDPLRFVNRPWLISRGLFGGARCQHLFLLHYAHRHCQSHDLHLHLPDMGRTPCTVFIEGSHKTRDMGGHIGCLLWTLFDYRTLTRSGSYFVDGSTRTLWWIACWLGDPLHQKAA